MFPKKVVVVLALSIIVAVVYIVFDNPANNHNAQTPIENKGNVGGDNTVFSKANNVSFSTLKDVLQQNKSMQTASASTQGRPFTKEQVFMALEAVKIDANGDVVLDHATLIALDEALERLHAKLTPSDLLALKKLITDALPGKVGEQVALLVENYTEFLGAKEVFSSTQESLVEPNMASPESIEDNEQLYNELKALRELHLGESTASNLFSVTDASAAYMFNAMKLTLDSSLNEQEITAAHLELQKKQIRDALLIDDWDERYARFSAEWSSIKSASLPDGAKQQEFKALLSAHFSALEREKMAYFGLTTATE